MIARVREAHGDAAARAVRDRVESLLVSHLPPLAVAAELGPHQTRELGVQGLVIQPHAPQGRRAVAGYEHVRIGQQAHHGLHALLGLQVQRDPFAVETAAVERRIVDVGLELHAPGNALRALVVADFALYLVDRRAQLPQQPRAPRSRREHGEVHHLESLQSAHRASFPFAACPSEKPLAFIIAVLRLKQFTEHVMQ